MVFDTKLSYLLSLFVRLEFVLILGLSLIVGHGLVAKIGDALISHHLAPLLFIGCGFLALVLRILEKQFPDPRLMRRIAALSAVTCTTTGVRSHLFDEECSVCNGT